MKRPIFITAIASINGILIGVYFKKSIPLFALILIIDAFVSIYKKYKSKKNSLKTSRIIMLYSAFLILFAYYSSFLNYKYDNKYSKYYDGSVKITATIISDVQEKEYIDIYQIKIDSINGKNNYKGDQFFLRVKKNKKNDKLKYGDEISFEGTIENTKGRKNENGFDYKFYLKTRKIYGTILTEESTLKCINHNNLSFMKLIDHSISIKIKDIFYKKMPEETANLELGILLGYTEKLDSNIIDAFKDSSIIHMIAVSGQHIAYVQMMAYFFLKRKAIGIKTRKIVLIIVLLVFIRITGSTVSVMRAGSVAIISIIASLLYRKNDVKTTLALSILINIISNPFTVFQTGTQLSYAGTAGILLLFVKVHEKIKNIMKLKIKIKENKILSWVIKSAALTLSANILILPISIYHNSTISFSFVLSNLIVAPLIGIAMMMGIMLIFFSFLPNIITRIPFTLLNYLLKLIIEIATFFSKLSISKIYICTPTVIEIVLLYIIIFFIIYGSKEKMLFREVWKSKIKQKAKIIIYILLIIIIFGYKIISYLPKNKMIISFIDVGQGDSMLIETQYNKRILIDGGGSEAPENYDIGKQVLLPFLLSKKIKTIDYVLISHFDSDHVRPVY